MEIVIVGGGAAGFFAAANLIASVPGQALTILEKSSKLLSKVRVSGGGRCNVTHAMSDKNTAVKSYPRGERELVSAFSRFSFQDTVDWFGERGVRLKTEADGRMFPVTDNSQTIIDCLQRGVMEAGVHIKLNAEVEGIEKQGAGFILRLRSGEGVSADKVLVAMGGHPGSKAYQWLARIGHSIIEPAPSLFTFNVRDKDLRALLGVAVAKARVDIVGAKISTEGPLLITHWGFSGPAILKLSAMGARILKQANYQFGIRVNWLPELSEEALREKLMRRKAAEGAKNIHSSSSEELPRRLWLFLLGRAGIGEALKWADVSKATLSKLLRTLLFDEYSVAGKTTFKDEFVTCGGIDLREIDMRAMESKICPGLYFAGEVLDIDGVTGGFNFQAAWTTAWIAARSMAENGWQASGGPPKTVRECGAE